MNLVKQIFSREKQETLSILKDPFSGQSVVSVRLNWSKKSFGEGVLIYSTITFQNGDTKGEQEISADSMDELIQKTKAFIETLPGKK